MGKILKKKIALITGGGSGIGRASALLFAQEGAKVIVANRRIEKGEETVNMIKEAGGEAIYIQTDVSKGNNVETLINKIINKYDRLDCAFNCGGIDGKPAPIVECEEEDWDEIIDINLKGTFLLMKYEIRQMLKQGYGSIVNMTSICGIIARPRRCAYNASRHGVIGLTKTAALEYAKKGIRVNAVGPGSIRTDIYVRSTKGDPEKEKKYAEAHPIGRVGEPSEVAEAALWLCSDKASFVVGHTLMVDGGFIVQ
ncbi:MAG: SDR family oxidoreductase [Spirochaetes bacterium]|nr:SDR family oxidoreductase [Spirochaetota bacterium]